MSDQTPHEWGYQPTAQNAPRQLVDLLALAEELEAAARRLRIAAGSTNSGGCRCGFPNCSDVRLPSGGRLLAMGGTDYSDVPIEGNPA